MEDKKIINLPKDDLGNYKEIEKQYDELIKINKLKVRKYDYKDRIIYEKKNEEDDRL